MRQSDAAGELVYGVPYADVQSLTENPVVALAQGENLRVGSADIDHGRVTCSRLPLAHFDMGHAVVDTDQRYIKAQRKSTRRCCHCAQARPQARTLGESNGI